MSIENSAAEVSIQTRTIETIVEDFADIAPLGYTRRNSLQKHIDAITKIADHQEDRTPERAEAIRHAAALLQGLVNN
jgi:hypothetical protein